jgi:hypothetical protein
MEYFQTKYTNLGKFWKALEGKMLAHFMATWNILRPCNLYLGLFDNLLSGNLVYLVYCTKKHLATLRRSEKGSAFLSTKTFLKRKRT